MINFSIRYEQPGITYHKMPPHSVINGLMEVFTEGIWKNNYSFLTSTYTSSHQADLNRHYYLNVYEDSSCKTMAFSISYGNYFGSHSLNPNYPNSTKAIYSQISNLLYNGKKVTFSNYMESNEFICLSFPREKYKDALTVGSFLMEITSSLGSFSLVDCNLKEKVSDEYGYIVSGSYDLNAIQSVSSSLSYGAIFYKKGIVLLNFPVIQSLISNSNLLLTCSVSRSVNDNFYDYVIKPNYHVFNNAYFDSSSILVSDTYNHTDTGNSFGNHYSDYCSHTVYFDLQNGYTTYMPPSSGGEMSIYASFFFNVPSYEDPAKYLNGIYLVEGEIRRQGTFMDMITFNYNIFGNNSAFFPYTEPFIVANEAFEVPTGSWRRFYYVGKLTDFSSTYPNKIEFTFALTGMNLFIYAPVNEIFYVRNLSIKRIFNEENLPPTKFILRSDHKIEMSKIFLRVSQEKCNFSFNPTYIDRELNDGSMLHPEFFMHPRTYVTNIGFYNDDRELLAVAKLTRPVLKTFLRELALDINLIY